MEELGIKAEFEQMAMLLINCQNKHEFISTYKALKIDFETNFGVPSAGNPNFARQVNDALRKVFAHTIQTKLFYMATWFCIAWGNARERSRAMNNDSGVESVIQSYAGGRKGRLFLKVIVIAFVLVAIAMFCFQLMAN
jgi:hypothetical protein